MPHEHALEEGLRALVDAIQTTGVQADHLIPDLVAVGLTREVYENAQATLLVARSGVPRAVYPTARAAFEAAQDLALLVTASDYDSTGARAFVAELLDWERSAELASAVFKARGQPDPIEPIRVDHALAEAVSAWEQYAPGKGQLLRSAFESVQRDRAAGKFHWSGFKRGRIHVELGKRPGSQQGMAEIYRSWYNLLSFQSHPSPRLDTRHMDYSDDVGVSLLVQPETPGGLSDLGVSAAYVAVQTSIVLLRDVRNSRDGA